MLPLSPARFGTYHEPMDSRKPRVPPDTLAWLALVVIAEATERLGPDPEPPSPSTRLALAVLHALGRDGKDHAAEFWRTIRDPMPWNDIDTGRAYQRRTMARSVLIGLGRSVGYELCSMDLHTRLFAAVRRSAD